MTDHTHRERVLLATILSKNPAFGTKGYNESVAARIHRPTHAGPGPEQRHLPGPWKVS